MARSVYDVAAVLSVLTGVDPADGATKKSEGKFSNDYAKNLDTNALKGARIGLARDSMSADPDVDWVIDAAIASIRQAGATVVDVRFPKWLMETKDEFFRAIRCPEFIVQIKDYLATLGPKYPKSLDEMIERANHFTSMRADGARPNASRWTMFKAEAAGGSMEDYRYTSVRDYGLPMMRAAVEGILASQHLDAIVYPTSARRPALINAPPDPPGSSGPSATNIANLTGFPDLVVPAGFTGDALPVGISFFGPAFSEQKLLALGYSFEQLTHARRLPVHAPKLEGDFITIP